MGWKAKLSCVASPAENPAFPTVVQTCRSQDKELVAFAAARCARLASRSRNPRGTGNGGNACVRRLTEGGEAGATAHESIVCKEQSTAELVAVGNGVHRLGLSTCTASCNGVPPHMHTHARPHRVPQVDPDGTSPVVHTEHVNTTAELTFVPEHDRQVTSQPPPAPTCEPGGAWLRRFAGGGGARCSEGWSWGGGGLCGGGDDALRGSGGFSCSGGGDFLSGGGARDFLSGGGGGGGDRYFAADFSRFRTLPAVALYDDQRALHSSEASMPRSKQTCLRRPPLRGRHRQRPPGRSRSSKQETVGKLQTRRARDEYSS